MSHTRLSSSLVVLASTAFLLTVPPPARAANDAFVRLLEILRDRGSITTLEYEELKRAAEAPEGIPAPQAPAAPAVVTASELETRLARQQAEIQKTQSGKWYERFGLRGYTQFRFTETGAGEGPPLDVPADRSANETESFIIRRGRFILSGDVSEHLSLYAQSDFNASTGAADFSLQMRDLYADVWLNKARTYRVRVGQSKVPFGWVNLQSSQNRAALERPDGINSAAETERDLGVYLMWASPVARQRFRDLVSQGLKGSGDYGVVAVGAYSGQGPNRADLNGEPHVLARASYPFKLASGQYFELGAQAYRGKFVTPVQPIVTTTGTVTPTRPLDGVTDERAGISAVWYPQPFGVEAEWNVGRGPELSEDLASITAQSLNGGYIQVNYRRVDSWATWFPFVRWNYFDGGRKFARNAPLMKVNEMDLGLELAKWAELELTLMYTHTFERTRTSLFPYTSTRDANRLGFQVQWNY